MSRIGRLPVAIPAGVTVKVDDHNVVTVKGPKGELTQHIHNDMKIEIEGATLRVSRPSDDKDAQVSARPEPHADQQHDHRRDPGLPEGAGRRGRGLPRADAGQEPGSHHRLLASGRNGSRGRHRLRVPRPPNKIIVKGIDKQLVGAIAANVRSVREPEPYHGKGIKYETEVIRRKEGKTGKK